MFSLGYDVIVFPRPALYELLLAKIPRHKISFKKKVLSVQETGTGVVVNCADNSSYEGDIVVGADGAYSAVRQSLYKQLEKQNKLPASDAAQMNGTQKKKNTNGHPCMPTAQKNLIKIESNVHVSLLTPLVLSESELHDHDRHN